VGNEQETKSPAATTESSSSSEKKQPVKVKVGDRVWYRDYSGVLMALVASVSVSGNSASLSVLTRAGQWLGRPDCPRYEKEKYGMPSQGMWSLDEKDLL
jgi:hypothetical protein